MQRSCGDAIILDVLRHLLTASKEGSYLGNIRERDHVPDGAEICTLWLRPFASDVVVVKGYLIHTKFRLAGFDLYTGTLATAYESLKQFINKALRWDLLLHKCRRSKLQIYAATF